MSTRLTLECDGCFAKADGTQRIARKFVSFDGKGWGVGRVHEPVIDEAVPDGWVWSDPYTHCTYCPECWASIEAGEDETQPRAKSAE